MTHMLMEYSVKIKLAKLTPRISCNINVILTNYLPVGVPKQLGKKVINTQVRSPVPRAYARGQVFDLQVCHSNKRVRFQYYISTSMPMVGQQIRG